MPDSAPPPLVITVEEDKATALDSERPRTTYEITSKGRAAFRGYIKVLEAIVKHSKPH